MTKDPVIYIVDPNPVHGNLVKFHLVLRKFTGVWLFTNAEECLYRSRKQAPDFVVSESSPESHSGLDFLRNIRSISPDTQVLFLTSEEDSMLASLLLEHGATDFIVKSSRPEQSIRELCDNLSYLVDEWTGQRVR